MVLQRNHQENNNYFGVPQKIKSKTPFKLLSVADKEWTGHRFSRAAPETPEVAAGCGIVVAGDEDLRKIDRASE